MLIQYDETRLL